MEFEAPEGEVIDLDADGPADGAIDVDLQVEPSLKHLSPSSAGMYQQCARKWKFRYLDRLPDPPGPAALTGTFAHRALELLLQEPADNRTEARAKELARVAWPETAEDADYQALELDDKAARHFRWQGWTAIKGLWKLENPALVDVVATEQRVDTMIGEVPFRGIVDRLDNEPDGQIVADYKSGRAPSPRYREGRLAQVLLYAAAIAAETGVVPVRARLLYLGQRIIETPVTDEAVGAAVETLTATWNNVQSDCARNEFEPTTGPLCAWCPFASQCPEGMAEVTKRHKAGRVRLDAPAVALLPVAS